MKLDDIEYRLYTSENIKGADIPAESCFVINSMPKSGTVWMAAMLEHLLHLSAGENLFIGHVADIKQDYGKPHLRGTVALVRNIEDVILSWFGHLQSADIASGYCAPRYQDVEEFYFLHFLGQLNAKARYWHGDLVAWLDFLAARSIPILKFEDLRSSPEQALGKVLNHWKISCEEPHIASVIQRCSRENISTTLAGSSGVVADLYLRDHLHHSRRVAGIQLTKRIKSDIEKRFREYKERLDYVDS